MANATTATASRSLLIAERVFSSNEMCSSTFFIFGSVAVNRCTLQQHFTKNHRLTSIHKISNAIYVQRAHRVQRIH